MGQENSTPAPNCAACPFKAQDRLCYEGEKHPDDCPTASKKHIFEKSSDVYAQPEIQHMARESARVERGSYHITPEWRSPARSRLQEIIAYCKAMDYKRVGLVFCNGLRNEAAEVLKVFKAHGLDVVSASCKVGGIPKTEIGLSGPNELLKPHKPESMCNSIGQAFLMNEANVDFNVLLGLCVGHDSLAIKYLEAPVTVLAVKDRMLGHNPLAAVYCGAGYFNYIKQDDDYSPAN